MLKDLKTGLALWRNMTNPKYAVLQFIAFAAAGCMAVVFAAPELYGRVKSFSSAVNMDGDHAVMALASFHILVFGIMMKRIVYEAYDKNQDLFYQLAVSKATGCICTMFQQLNWYGYALVMLLAICDKAVVPRWLLISAYTLLYVIGFRVYYNRVDSGICKRKKISFGYRTGRRKGEDIFRHYPTGELFLMTVSGLYQCKSLMAGKILLILFIIYCGSAHMLGAAAFLLAEAFLILLNDEYWKKESGNFRYFSAIGIPVSRYLCVHFLAGVCFNVGIPLLLFYGMTGETVTAAAGFVLLSYLLIFWYLSQMYLTFVIGRDKEAAIILCDIGFLIIAALPPAGLAAAVWLYKRIGRRWREEECFR